MLAYTQLHNKEGIDELRLLAVETIRASLGDARWEFMTTERDPDLQAVLATVGNNRYGVPDLIIGFGVTEKGLGHLRSTFNDLLAYLEWNKEFTSGDIDMEDYYAFLIQQRGYVNIPKIDPTVRMYLRHVDATRWLAGQGWQHAQFYNADECENARFLQLVMADEKGRLPWDEDYSFIQQQLLESEPFGKKPVAAPTTARAHYLN